MSTAGQGVGGIVGAIAGALLAPATAGASLTWGLYGAQIGMIAGGLLDPPKGPSQHGPSPDQLRLTTSTYGANIPRVYGTCPVAGNVVWLEGDKYRVKKKKSGGKGGGSVTTYKIFATFAVVLCEGPIVGIRRLWLGSELVYDGAAATTAGVIKSGKSKSSWKLYTGTDTQQPDPRYQADKGANAASGWPGLAYIVFYDLPLEKWQNTLAGVQIKAEIVTAGSSSYSQIVSVADIGIQFDTNYITGVGTPYIRTVADGIITVGLRDSATSYLFTADGVKKGVKIDAYPPILSRVIIGPPTNFFCCGEFEKPGQYLWISQVLISGVYTLRTNTVAKGAAHTSRVFIAQNLPDVELISAVMATDNSAVMLLTAENLGSGYRWYEIDTSGDVLSTGIYSASVPLAGNPWGYARGLLAAGSGGASCYDRQARTMMYAFGSGNIAMYTINDNGTLTQYHSATLIYGTTTYPSVFLVGRVGFALASKGMQVFADALAPATVTLDTVVQTECLQSNLLTSGDLDVTDLDADPVRGFRVSDTGPIRASLEPLSLVWPFDVRMHGYKLQFVRRGSASVASVPAADLDARLEGSDPGPLLTLPRDMDTQLPQKVVLGFLDVDREYDRGEQEAARYNTDARNIAEPEVAVVLNAQEGKR